MTKNEAIGCLTAAVRASSVVGMGFLQASDEPVTFECIERLLGDKDRLYLDYFEGRMVKTGISKSLGGGWTLNFSHGGPDYQSWMRKYKDLDSLRIAGLYVLDEMK